MPGSAVRFMKTVYRLPFTAFRYSIYAFLLLTTSCIPAAPAATSLPVRVQYSFAAQPWLASLSDCAGNNIMTAELVAANIQDPQSTDLALRLGYPDGLASPAYQIGTDDILVIVNRQNPVTKLTSDQVRGLFTGRIQNWQPINNSNAQVQVWVFPNGEDVQQIFTRTVLGGSSNASTARQANNPDEMAQAVQNDANAIGLTTRHWITKDVSGVFTSASNLPVLVIPRAEPPEFLAQIIACLQK